MKLTFREFIKENTASNIAGGGAIAGKDIPLGEKVPNAHLVRRRYRYQLPQIADLSKLEKDLKMSGIPSFTETVDNHSLIPSQLNFSQKKVDQLANSNSSFDGIVVSSDLKIIDGHHRFAANFVNGRETKITKIGLEFDEALKFLKNKDYVIKRSMK